MKQHPGIIEQLRSRHRPGHEFRVDVGEVIRTRDVNNIAPSKLRPRLPQIHSSAPASSPRNDQRRSRSRPPVTRERRKRQFAGDEAISRHTLSTHQHNNARQPKQRLQHHEPGHNRPTAPEPTSPPPGHQWRLDEHRGQASTQNGHDQHGDDAPSPKRSISSTTSPTPMTRRARYPPRVFSATDFKIGLKRPPRPPYPRNPPPPRSPPAKPINDGKIVSNPTMSRSTTDGPRSTRFAVPRCRSYPTTRQRGSLRGEQLSFTSDIGRERK